MTRKDFYRSRQWEAFRRVVIAERTDEDGFVRCAMCGKPILKPYDLVVDHISELTEANVNDASVSLNPDNVQLLHFKCHNQKHERFGFGSGWKPKPRMVYIVYGPPCAGKGVYVRQHAAPYDLVVDMDSIWEMVSANPRNVKPDRLKSVVYEIRDRLYDVIKYRSGRWIDAYVITGGARAGDRARLKDRVGADEMIFIEEEKEVCLKRAERERPAEWKGFIEEWFDSYQPEEDP